MTSESSTDEQQRRRGARRTAIGVAVVALMVYIGFMMLTAFGN